MRIGLIVSTFPPYQGGMGNMAWSYALGLSRRGHDVEVFCPAVRGGLERELDAPFAIRRLRPWVRFRNSAFIPQLAVRMGGFDAVNLHYPFYGGAEAIFALKTIKGKKLPLVVNFQMDNFGAGAAGLAFKANAAVLTTRLLSAADKVIVTSADYAAHSAAALAYEKFPAKFAAIPPGVDRTRFNPGPKDQSLLGKYGISAGEKVVLFVGGLDRAHAFKGVGFLLEAWRSLEPGRARLLIVGRGDLRDSYRRTAERLGLGRSVIFADPVGPVELPAYYRLADLFVLPSTDSSEAFGIVLIEAMACGVPVLAADLPGVRSVVESGRNGFLFGAREAGDLLDKARPILINEKLRRSLSAGAREIAASLYDQEKIWDRVDAVFREVAGG
jgi:glycosyltransferase involved in cell wall biosynthesis